MMTIGATAVGVAPQHALAQSSNTDVTVGLGAMYSPDYEGSDDYETSPVPLIDITVNDRFRFSTLNGVEATAQVLASQGFEGHVGLGYSMGRDTADNVALGGLGNIDSSATFIASMSYALMQNGPSELAFALDIESELNGNRKGTTVGLGVDYRLPIASQRTSVTLSAGSTWADDKYMASTFGITAAQSAASVAGLSTHSAAAGFKDVSLGVNMTYQLGDRMALVGNVGFSRLLKDAAASPLVKTHGSKDQSSAALGVVYSW